MSKIIYNALDAEIDRYIEEQKNIFGSCFRPEKLVIKEPETEREVREKGLSINNKKGGEKKMSLNEAFLAASKQEPEVLSTRSTASRKVLKTEDFKKMQKEVFKRKSELRKKFGLQGINTIAIRLGDGSFINKNRNPAQYRDWITKLYEAI